MTNPSILLCEKCKKNPATEVHDCPWIEFLYEEKMTETSPEDYCTCCKDCEQECRDDI